jgi:hypothetical protein
MAKDPDSLTAHQRRLLAAAPGKLKLKKLQQDVAALKKEIALLKEVRAAELKWVRSRKVPQ